MLWILLTTALLLCGKTQGQGYDYNRPNKPFAPSPGTGSSGLPGSASQTNGYPSAPGVQAPSGNGYPSAGPIGPSQIPSQPSLGQGPAQSFPSGQYPNQSPSSPLSKYQGQAPAQSFPSGQYPNQPQSSVPSSKYPGQAPAQNFPSGQYPNQPQSSVPSSKYPGQAPAQNFPTGQYPNQAQSSSAPGQTPGFPGFPSQQPQYTETRPSSPGFPGSRPPSQFPEVNKSNLEDGLGEPFAGGSQDDGQYHGGQEDGDYSAIPGEPEVDYPIYSYVPETSFKCEDQQYPGYYADVETRCQVFHICANKKMYDFLCPNGTVFHQEYLVCVWWNQFDCNSAPSLYGINANIYDYSRTYPSQQGLGYSQSPDQTGYSPESQQVAGYPGFSPQSAGARPQSQSFPAPQAPELSKIKPQESIPTQRRPEYPSSRPQTPQETGPSYPGSSAQQPERGYPQGPAFSSQAPGYPTLTSQKPSPGYQQGPIASGYPAEPQTPSFGGQSPVFNGLSPQNQAPGFSTLQPQGFTSSDAGYPEPASQTPSYPESGPGYPGSQTPSAFTKPSQGPTTPGVPTSGSTYPETSYPKPQTPLPGFGSTGFIGSPSYSENDQTGGYPTPSKPSVPFFGANDVQQQRQYLPPVNG